MDFQHKCACGCPGPGALLIDVKGGQLSEWQKVLAKGQIKDLTCEGCQCEHNLVDGGNAITCAHTPKPRLDSIDVAGGPAAGGTAVTLTGHALSTGTLVVKFGGVPALNLRNVSGAHATVDSPPGLFLLLIQGSVTGTLAPGDAIGGVGSGKTALIVSVGATSLVVAAPSGEFAGGEVVQKDANNHVQLAGVPSPLVGVPVDVTVENENGMKRSGAKLAGAFTYSVP